MFVRNRFLSWQIFAAIACRPRTRESSRGEINYFLELVSEIYCIQIVYGAHVVDSRSNPKLSSQRADCSAVFSVFRPTTARMDWGIARRVPSPAYHLSLLFCLYPIHRHSEQSIIVGQVCVCRERNCCATSSLSPAQEAGHITGPQTHSLSPHKWIGPVTTPLFSGFESRLGDKLSWRVVPALSQSIHNKCWGYNLT